MFLMPKRKWNICRAVLFMAGVFVALSVLLGYLVHPYLFLMAGMVGLMLIVLSTTGFCPMAALLHKYGVQCDMTDDKSCPPS